MIIGGGITGLSIAYALKQTGLKVVVLEKNTIGSGTTGGTTGKVTTQHGIIYDKITKQFGTAKAQTYATASQRAFDAMATLITDNRIACGWQRADNYVYTANPKKVKQFEDEVAAATALGLPASLESNLALPFETVAAVKFTGQAMIDAYKYTKALATLVDGGGSHVFENSNATGIHEGRPCTVKAGGHKVTAKNIIVATKVPAAPLVGRMTYAAMEFPLTSYLVAGTYEGNLQGMYISPDKQHYSLLPIQTEQGQMLLVGGQGHITGLKRPKPQQQKLAGYAQKWFGVEQIQYRWKAMDYVAYDNLPLIGKLYPWSEHTYFAGGLKKWGLNLSMVAAQVITELIHDTEPAAAKLFSPYRASAPASIPLSIVRGFKH